jgi:hypothetical protein
MKFLWMSCQYSGNCCCCNTFSYDITTGGWLATHACLIKSNWKSHFSEAGCTSAAALSLRIKDSGSGMSDHPVCNTTGAAYEFLLQSSLQRRALMSNDESEGLCALNRETFRFPPRKTPPASRAAFAWLFAAVSGCNVGRVDALRSESANRLRQAVGSFAVASR